MNKQNKKKFIKDFCKQLSNNCIAKVSNMPENWDGVELRQFIEDQIDSDLQGQRKRDYENEVIVRNL